MKDFPVRVLALAAALIFSVPGLMAQADRAQSKVDIVQRYDVQRTIDGHYAGLFYGYSRATWFLMLPSADGSIPVEARWYLTDESLNDLGHVEKQLSNELSSTFRWLPDGSIKMTGAGPAPFVRGFPAPPPPGVLPGQYWDAFGSLTVDPDGSGKWTTLKLYVRYTLQGFAIYNGHQVLDVRARYAVRYKSGDDPQGNPALQSAEGSRESTIYLNPETNFPVFIREHLVNENWVFSDSKRIKNDGFILWFFEGGIFESGTSKIAGIPTAGPAIAQTPTTMPAYVPMPTTTTVPGAVASVTTTVPSAVASVTTTTTILAASLAELMHAQTEKIRNDLKDQDIEGVDVKPDPRGTALTLQNLLFVADSPELLPGENVRLDRIAALLKTVSAEKSFLIRGHTAKAGTEAGQLALSQERAKRIMKALIQRGLAPGRFYWEGKGSTQPIADNDTEEGKAKNRRVEIIILE